MCSITVIVYRITVKLSDVKHQFVMFTDSVGQELRQLSKMSISAPWHPRPPLEDSHSWGSNSWGSSSSSLCLCLSVVSPCDLFCMEAPE